MVKSHSLIKIIEKTLQESKRNTVNQGVQKDATNLKEIIVAAIEDAKGNDIKVIEVAHLTQVTDYMVIASGTSNRHIQTIAETSYKSAAEHGFERIGMEGLGQSEWVVIDFADVVLHVMSPAAREHYNIEGLWDIQSETDKS